MREANRLLQVKEYYFSAKLKEIATRRHNGEKIINMGVGSPDLPPPPEVISALNFALGGRDAHQYQPYRGTAEFRTAVGEFYHKHYNVDLSPESEVIPLMGSKEGISHISTAFLNEGDEVLIPDPGYPTYAAATKMTGAIPIYYQLTEKNQWMPDLQELGKRDLSQVKLMWVNYPHMPTGAPATASLFQDLIAFAKENDILIVNDNPYSFILNETPVSLLEVPGAKQVAMELNSLSKSFNMSGWRVGMLCASEEHINSVLKVKTNMDSGMFLPVLAGATAALKLKESWFERQNEIYSRRKEQMLKFADAIGCRAIQKQAGMFIWASIPEGISSEDFVENLLISCGVFIAPGSIFGSCGEGYVRFSLCIPEEIINKAIKKVKEPKFAII